MIRPASILLPLFEPPAARPALLSWVWLHAWLCLFVLLLVPATQARAQQDRLQLDHQLLIGTNIFAAATSESDTRNKASALDLTDIQAPSLKIHEATQDTALNLPVTTTTDNTDLWQRVRNGFAMPDLDDPLVAAQQRNYLRHPAGLQEILQRSRRYLYFIVEELESRNLPTELALLPVIESAYNPLAYSRAHAAGLWQFIPTTGKSHQLRQDWWHDQRLDVIASTRAALDYLQNIQHMHNDWQLTVLSYNWGEFAVARAIERNRQRGLPTDYRSLEIPQKLRDYLPRLQALKNIIAAPQHFDLDITPIPNQAYFDTVALPDSIDIALAAQLADISLDEFQALNPAYKRPLIPHNKSSEIVLPADRVNTFLLNLAHHEASAKPLSSWTTHILQQGETLSHVAARFKLSTRHLQHANDIRNPRRLRPGTRLLIPRLTTHLAQH